MLADRTSRLGASHSHLAMAARRPDTARLSDKTLEAKQLAASDEDRLERVRFGLMMTLGVDSSYLREICIY